MCARIKYSGLVDSINGSINGTTFQRNRYGSTVKGKPIMRKPWTQAQQRQKGEMLSVAKAWRDLSELDRQDWNLFAENNPRPTRLNPDSYLSGYNYFLLYNRYRWLADVSMLSSPSLVLQTTFDPEMIIYYTGGQLYWETNVLPGQTGSWKAMLFLTPVIPYGREFVSFTPRYIYAASYNASAAFDITNQYLSVLGSLPPSGEWIGVKIVLYCETTAQIVITPRTQVQILTV